MFPGGLSDKYGNRYEAWWLVYSLLRVIDGEYDSIKFEGVDAEFEGFEFSLSNGDKSEWHQTKRNAPHGNWTLRSLEREGVWSAFEKRLAGDENAICRFVSQDNASDLREICDEARLCNSVEQLLCKVSQKKREIFEQARKAWNTDDPITFVRLRRTFFHTSNENDLSPMVERLSRHLIQSEAPIFPRLREYMENNFNKSVSTEEAREWLRQQVDLSFKDWLNDPTVAEAILNATDSYLDTYTPFGAGGETIGRKECEQLVAEIQGSQGADLILLSGDAGAGKSGVVRQAITELRRDRVRVLAFRIDQLLDKRNAREIGNELIDRDASPVSILKSISSNRTSVLIIDQVDAVSEVSGRDGQVRNAIFELIREGKQFGGVKVVAVCRNFDLENDDRFRSLKADLRTCQINVPLLDWETETKPLLIRKGYDTSNFGAKQQELLTLPVNLAVFLETGDDEFNFSSRTELFSRLFKAKQKQLTKIPGVNWPLIEPLSDLAHWMSDRQQLTAPSSILDPYPGCCDWLASEGLIVAHNDQVNFFHESFFDWAYARGFVKGGNSVHDLLLSAEQHLFRRTQIRQILTSLRETDLQRYLIELAELLRSRNVRFHVKMAIAQWLSSITEPVSQELYIVLGLQDETGPFSPITHNALLSTKNWFPLLHSCDCVKTNLSSNGDPRHRQVWHWLSNIAGQFPDQIAEIMRSWWDARSDRGEELVDWFGFIRRSAPDEALLTLCRDIIKSRPTNLFREDGRNRIMMVLDTWSDTTPEQCGHLLKELFDAWFALHPNKSLLDREDWKELDSYSLKKVAEKAPEAFLQGTTSALQRTISETVEAGQEGPHWWKLRYRHKSKYLSGFEEFVHLYSTALFQVAKSQPEKAQDFLSQFDPSEHELSTWLHLRCITANPSAFHTQLSGLLTCSYLLSAGYDGAKWEPFAEAATAALRANHEVLDEIESFILQIRPEIELAQKLLERMSEDGEDKYLNKKSVVSQLGISGHKQWCILRKIGSELLSSRGRNRLIQLDRKFIGFEPDEASLMEIREVQSPIAPNAAEKMTDKQWLSAIKKYNSEDIRSRDRRATTGGADQLSGLLENAAKSDPNRLIDLYWRIPKDAHHSYISALLCGWRDAEYPNHNRLAEVVVDVHSNSAEKHHHRILSLLEQHSDLTKDTRVSEILFNYLEFGSAREEPIADTEKVEKGTLSIERLLDGAGGLVMRNAGGSRPHAWETLGRIIWQQEHLIDRLWVLLEQRALEEPLVSVRCVMVEVMPRLFNDDRQRFSSVFRLLVEHETDEGHSADRCAPLGTRHAAHLLPYIGYNLPELAEWLIDQLLEAGDEKLELIGAWYFFCEAFRRGFRTQQVEVLSQKSTTHQVLLADVAGDVIAWAEHSDLAEEHLIHCFEAPDDDVRKQASDCFRTLKKDEFERRLELAKKFIGTQAFLDHPSGLFFALEDATCHVSGLVIEAGERLLRDVHAKKDQHGTRSTGLHQLQDLLKREYASSIQNPADRKQLLDIIDFMLEADIYGADSIIEANER